MSSFIKMALAYDMQPPLSRVSNLETLRRHLVFAVEHGTCPVAAEYLAEIARREAANEIRRQEPETERAAA